MTRRPPPRQNSLLVSETSGTTSAAATLPISSKIRNATQIFLLLVAFLSSIIISFQKMTALCGFQLFQLFHTLSPKLTMEAPRVPRKEIFLFPQRFSIRLVNGFFARLTHCSLINCRPDTNSDVFAYGIFRTISGPSSFVTGTGSFCQMLMADRYFGFDGFKCGISLSRSIRYCQ
jgi:hypothetical protein